MDRFGHPAPVPADDLDFHSRHALVDTRPFLAELQRAFPGALELIQAPDARGSGFSAVLQLEDERLTLQVFAAFEDVPDHDLVSSSTESTESTESRACSWSGCLMPAPGQDGGD
jgi:hypothetical protein